MMTIQKTLLILGKASNIRQLGKPSPEKPLFQNQNDCFVRFGNQSKSITAQWFEKTKLGKASYASGDFENAYRFYRTALELTDPDSPEQTIKTLTRLARTCTSLKRYEEADRYLTKAAQTYPEKPIQTAKYEVTSALGELNLHWAQRSNDTDRLELAETYLIQAQEEFLEKYPDPIRGLTAHWESLRGNLGLVYKVKGDVNPAIEQIESALEANNSQKTPNLNRKVWYHSSLAKLYNQKQQDAVLLEDVSYQDTIQKHIVDAYKTGQQLLKTSPGSKGRIQAVYDDLAETAMLSGFKSLATQLAQKSQELQGGADA